MSKLSRIYLITENGNALSLGYFNNYDLGLWRDAFYADYAGTAEDDYLWKERHRHCFVWSCDNENLKVKLP